MKGIKAETNLLSNCDFWREDIRKISLNWKELDSTEIIILLVSGMIAGSFLFILGSHFEKEELEGELDLDKTNTPTPTIDDELSPSTWVEPSGRMLLAECHLRVFISL